MRLWFFRDEANMRLLENDGVTLEDAGFRDEDSLLVNKYLFSHKNHHLRQTPHFIKLLMFTYSNRLLESIG
jgi:hypothetical protein